MSVTKIYLVLITLAIIGCTRDAYIPDLSSTIDYNYRVTKYRGTNKAKENIVSYEYYNNNGLLTEQIGVEYRIKFIYNNQKELIEKYYCRYYNCEIGRREIFFYDDNRNYIGSFFTTDTIIKLDTINIDQIKLYNANNNLIKELLDKGTNIYGDKYEYWRSYKYNNGRIIEEIETNKEDTIWVGTYKYDSNNNLIEINRIQGELFEIETIEFNNRNKKIRKTIKSNENPITDDTSYSVNNNIIIYKYDKDGRLIKTTSYNHKGEIHGVFSYQYDYKQSIIH